MRSRAIGRLEAVFAAGFAAGVPHNLVGVTLAAWMASAKVDLTTIGVFALVSLPYSFKFLWAPFLDRWALPILGRRRGWMAVLQLALGGALAVLGLIDPKAAPAALATAAVVATFIAASHDIVVDAYRTDLLPEEQRGPGASAYVAAYRAAMIATSAGALVASTWLPWRIIYALAGALMALAAIGTWISPEPADPGQPPRTLAAAVVEPLADLFGRPGAWMLVGAVGLFKVGEFVVQWMIQPYLFGLRYTPAEVGAVNNGLGLAATIGGAIAGGIFTARLGVRRALLLFGALQCASNLLYLALPPGNRPAMIAIIGADNLCTGLATAAFVTFLMSLCSPAFSATQYAVLSSLSGLAGRLLTVPSGLLAKHAGWPALFAATIAISLPALLLLSVHGRVTDRSHSRPGS